MHFPSPAVGLNIESAKILKVSWMSKEHLNFDIVFLSNISNYIVTLRLNKQVILHFIIS